MIDGIFLNKLLNELMILKTGRISKINESGDTDFVFTIRVNRENHLLMLSTSTEYSRIHLSTKKYDSVLTPKGFTLFLRKHIEGYFIEDITQYNSDRVITFTLKGYNELEDLNTKYLIIEVMGRYSNLVLTDSEYRILDSIKHDGVGEFNRTIMPNAIYEYPKSDKLNPFDYNIDELNEIIKNKKINNPKDLMSNFNGISSLLSNYIFKDEHIAYNLYEFIHKDIEPNIYVNDKNKEDFYYLKISNNIINEYDSLSKLLDEFYYDIDIKAKIKKKTGDLSLFINNQLNKFEKKLIKLNSELLETNNNDTLRLYGELLLSSSLNLKDKENEVTVYNYYDNTNINIKLDSKYTILENSNRFFKKYQKQKSSIKYINEQIDKTKSEIDYFKLLKYQISNASINESLDILDELIDNKYLFKEKTNKNKKKKPTVLTYNINGGAILIGKNNIQNEYITHHLAKPNDMWFHVKGAPGSHVVIKDKIPTEDDIRLAANLAAYYSEFKLSSSVPVDYTKIKNIKKIPGRKACFVTYTHEHTIYIDPDINIINNMEVKK